MQMKSAGFSCNTCVVEGGIHKSAVPEVCIQGSYVFKHTVLKK